MFEIEEQFVFSYPRAECAVTGWCCFEDGSPVEDLWILCDGRRTPALTGLSRPEIGRQLNMPAMTHGGFLARFAATGRTTATLAAIRDNRELVLGQVQIGSRAHRPETSTAGYAAWLRTHDTPAGGTARAEMRLRSLMRTPLLSVILPTYNTSLYHLHRCLESIRTQQYPHWQLCITDDGSSDRRVLEFLKQAAAAERRIRLTLAESRGGISVASNRSLEAATGDFVLLLDHDDEFHPSALLEVARCLNENPETDLIYSDEDKIDQIGVRSSPAFKPEYDHDLLCGYDYMGHLVAMRAALVRQVGGFSPDADGAQDWDLLLKTVAATTPDRIRHIPEPLYHWRRHEDSTAHSLDAKPYAVRAWPVVLARHTASATGVGVEEGLFRGSMRLRRAVPDGTRVEVVYRDGDGAHQRRCLARTRIPPGATFLALPDGVAAAGAVEPQAPRSDVTVVVNAAIESVNHFFLEELVAQAVRDDCAVVGGTILQPDGRVLTAGLACRSDGTWLNPYEGLDHEAVGYMGLVKVVREVPSIAPYAFAFRTARMPAGLLLRADNLADLCADLVDAGHAAGLRTLHTPYAVVTLRRPETLARRRFGALAPSLVLNRNLEAFSATGALQTGIP